MLYGYAIETTYYGPTNYHGARIVARFLDGSIGTLTRVTTPYDPALDARDNHTSAACMLLDRAGERRELHAFGSARYGYVFIAA